MSLRDRELCLSLTGICVFADRFYVQSAVFLDNALTNNGDIIKICRVSESGGTGRRARLRGVW